MPSLSNKSFVLSIPAAILAGSAIFWLYKNRRKYFQAVGYVSGMFIYPIKACRGIPLTSAKCLFEGLQHDRRWVIVDDNGKLLNAAIPEIVLISPHFDEDMTHLYLDAPGMETLKIPLSRKTDQVKEILISGSIGEGVCVGEEAGEWISRYLNKPGCQLCHVSKPRYLTQHPKWGFRGRQNDKTGFASTSSLLICSQSSLDELNKHYDSPVNMDRFRPNVIVNGGTPYEEHFWRRVKIGDDVQLRFVKECGRCYAINVDPATGEKSEEPLKTLNRVRKLPSDADPRHNGHPWFGLCVVPDTEGQIIVGDPVYAAS